jgi:hypothetical protein
MKKKKLNRKKKWQLVFQGRLEDFSAESSLQYWSNKSAEEKFKEVASLIKQANFIKNRNVDNGQEFLRTTAVIKRTQGPKRADKIKKSRWPCPR